QCAGRRVESEASEPSNGGGQADRRRAPLIGREKVDTEIRAERAAYVGEEEVDCVELAPLLGHERASGLDARLVFAVLKFLGLVGLLLQYGSEIIRTGTDGRWIEHRTVLADDCLAAHNERSTWPEQVGKCGSLFLSDADNRAVFENRATQFALRPVE